MTRAAARALALARPIIRGLTALNIVYGLGVALLLGSSFFIDDWPQRPLGLEMTAGHPWIGTGLRAIVAIGVIGAAIVHTILRRLLAIVDTVRSGDPFLLENARRLETIAWSVLTLEVLRLMVAAIAALVWEPFRVDAFSFASWLTVLLLFVLAGVFAHGARLREDLEGTV
jgi:hypothetical protein